MVDAGSRVVYGDDRCGDGVVGDNVPISWAANIRMGAAAAASGSSLRVGVRIYRVAGVLRSGAIGVARHVWLDERK